MVASVAVAVAIVTVVPRPFDEPTLHGVAAVVARVHSIAFDIVVAVADTVAVDSMPFVAGVARVCPIATVVSVPVHT